MSKQKLTPMFEQYLGIKDDHPDALLFYRMGDFYELFFDDAKIAAKELQIALTCRNPNSEHKVPMCGVPHHATEAYLTQLLEKGYKVAICDQVEDPKLAKGLVKRAVTRVLTPGTVVEDSNLQAKAHNYLAALYWDSVKGAGGLAWADFSTGEFSGLFSRRESELWQWALKMQPRELLLPQGKDVPGQYAEMSPAVTELAVRPHFDLSGSRDKLLEIQQAASLETLELADKPQLVQACGAIISYLRQTQLQDFGHLGEFKPLNLSRHLVLDEITERNLEIFRTLDGKTGKGTLWNVLDRTMTPMGGRLLESRLRQPWRDLPSIERSQESVEFLHDNDDLRESLRRSLDGIYDIERLSTRIFLGRALPRDFVALKNSLSMLPDIFKTLDDHVDQAPANLKKVLKNWDGMDDLNRLLQTALVDGPPPVITDGGLFKAGYDPVLDELINLTEHGEARVKALLERERDAAGIPKLKLGFNKVFGYYLEVSKAFKGQVPDHFIRRQTLVNSERYITDELKELEDRLITASDERNDLEYKLFQELRDTLAHSRERFMFMAGVLAGLDFWQGLAEAARENNWTRPSLHAGMEMEINAGRHPVVEAGIGAANYIPNNVFLDQSRRILLITGPNMSGKSTVLRLAAILTIMAQIGSYVPASKARIGLADRVFSRVGASDNLAQGRSTFMVEMMETARILRQAGSKSLVILDEIGRGTSTFDGLALAWSVVEELSRRGRGGIRTLFATHYHELTALEGKISGLKNMNIAVKEWRGDIVFLRKLVPGPADRSYGIEVAKLAGVPRIVVERAKELLAQLEEKSQNARSGIVEKAAQPTLPGLVSESVPAPVSGKVEHPVLTQLDELDLDSITPMQALLTLNQWKKMLENEACYENENDGEQ